MNLLKASRTTLALLLAGILLGGCNDDEASEAADLSDVAAPEVQGSDAEIDTATSALSAAKSALRADIACTPPAPLLVINEFMMDPEKVSDAYGEWVELFNPGATAVDLLNWTLRDDGTNVHTFASSVVVPPGGYVVLCRNADSGLNGGVPCTYQYSNFLLTNLPANPTVSNATDQIVLVDPAGTEIDRVDIANTVPTGSAIGLRHPYLTHNSLVLPASPNVQADWASLPFGITTTTYGLGDRGTPGARNADDVYVEQNVAECAGIDGDTDIACTWNTCRYIPAMGGTYCEAVRIPECCTTLAECDDKNVCTRDTCELATLKCAHAAVENCCFSNDECLDLNPCNADYCDSGNQCRHSAYNIVPGCCYVDALVNPATGNPWSTPLEMQAAADSQCDDKNVCTRDACNLQTNLCEAGPPQADCCTVSAECDDGDLCTYDFCIGNACQNPRVNSWCCTVDTECDDGSLCTEDRCILNSCRNLFNPDNCCATDTWCKDNADDHNPCTAEKCLLNPATGLNDCQHPFLANCQVPLPYIELFNDKDTFAAAGWNFIDYGTKALNHWILNSLGVLGPDKHVDFVWNPTTMMVKSVAHTPQINALSAQQNPYNQQLQKSTLQFRMSYKHSQPNTPIILRVIATDNRDFTQTGGGVILKEWLTNADIEYSLVSLELPDSLKFSPTLYIGFYVDTWDVSTFNMDSWTIDDVKFQAGVPNELLKSKIYRCPAGPGFPCEFISNGTSELIAEVGLPDPTPPPLTLSTDEYYRLVLCYRDPDATTASWQYNGFPGSFKDEAPMEDPPFLHQAQDQQANGCMTLPSVVASVCGTPMSPGYFFCVMDVRPEANEAYAGNYRSAIVTRDEVTDVTTNTLRSPFETQVKFNVNLILPDGYIVWAPNGITDPSAWEIFNQIQANGRKVQMLKDLSVIPDLTPYDGVFAVLGVYGRYKELTADMAARLQVYLDNGGKLYLEGGDFFYTSPEGQDATNLHPYFKAQATSDGTSRLDGPIGGQNFLYGYNFDYDQNGILNSWIDRLIHTPGAGGRQILKNEGSRSFATAVSYEDSTGYRTIASSVAFGGLIENASGASRYALMGKYLYFLENGYPDCVMVQQCQDFEVCTDDACNAGRCENVVRDACIPCIDDRTTPDGLTPACGEDQACNVALGYCVDIPHEDRYDATLDCNKLFGNNPTKAICTIDVPDQRRVADVHMKVMINHPYRGDVRLTLISPTGTRIPLKASSASDANRNVYFTYDAGVPTQVPLDLDRLTGERTNGVWQIEAEDVDPMVYNGLFQDWRLYTTTTALGCQTVADCPDDPCTISKDCLPNPQNPTENICTYTPMDCDDADECTIDSCDAGNCVNTPIEHCMGQCDTHADCPMDEACLDFPGMTRTCDPLNDIDPATGQSACKCQQIPGQIYRYTEALPVIIADALPAGFDATIPVGTRGFVKSMKVLIRTDHPAQGDLRARLCHGTDCVILRSQRGGATPGFYDIYDYDLIDWPGTLNVPFYKRSLEGEWTLNISDQIAGDTGRLTAFNLYVNKVDCYQDPDCDDANPCTIDTCQLPADGGTCVHTMKQCEPTDDPCKANQCNPDTGACELVAQQNGTPCEDGLFCSTDDSCLNGTCTAGPERDCSFLSESCTRGVCNEDLKQCRAEMSPDDSPCDDGDFCITGDYCMTGQCQPGCVGGVCHPGAQNICPCPNGDSDCVDDGDKCNGVAWACNMATRLCELQDGPVVCPTPTVECMINTCDPASGGCRSRPALNYMPCEDGLFCSVADYCVQGTCTGGQTRDCSGLDDECVTGICSEGAGSCQTTNKANGTACELDGRGCTQDSCFSGFCRFSSMVDCSATKDDCNDGVCQDVGWGGHVCVKGPLPDGTLCTDEPDPCTEDRCLGGWCQHNLLVNCSGPCGGSHPFDAGDRRCGSEDSCQNGILGYPNGACMPTCDAANCRRVASPLLDLPVDERLGCTVTSLELATEFGFVDDIEAKVRLDHGYLGDLTIDLIDPRGYSHRLWNHIGESYSNFSNTFDLSFPVPYPGIPTSGVPMCSLNGDDVNGTWYLMICDTGEGNGGVLHDWKLYVKGTDATDLNMGMRCENPIDLGPQDINPAQTTDGSTTCSINSITDSGCGGVNGPDRTYTFTLGAPKRVTIKLFQPERDMILVVKDANLDGSCAAGSKKCSQMYGIGAQPEIVDDQFLAGRYFVSVDTAGGPYDRGAYRFEIRVKTLLPNGANCVDPVLGEQDLDCLSNHCQNGYCCDTGDCCPGAAWTVPADGTDPNVIRTDPEWISADTVCPGEYKAPPVCRANDESVLPPVNLCQGDRHDANCVNFQCVKTQVNDDTACDNTVESDRCGHFVSEWCGDFGPVPPAAQIKPPCLANCSTDTDCDPDSHCDPAAGSTIPDGPTVDPICLVDLVNGAACNENTDCNSGHCQNGYCCDSGDCCPTDDVPGALTCPASWTVAPICDDASTCEGHRYDPVCSNNECGQVLVHDDCACGLALSDNCGLFIPIFCTESTTGCPATAVGAGLWHEPEPVCLESCLNLSGVEDDSLCDDIAHCDPDTANPPNSICKANVPNGFPCNENSDCENRVRTGGIGHCQNGFCCDSGDCCAQNTDCPFRDPPLGPTGYWAPPECDDATVCDGHRMDATCVNSTCGWEEIDDDSACTSAMVSDDCGYYLPIYCTGELTQIDPQCPTTCMVGADEDDAKCDADAHCDPDNTLPNQINSICVADLSTNFPAGPWSTCDEPSDCISGYCQIHVCCDAGLCCGGCQVKSAHLSMAQGGVNDNVAGCDPANDPAGCPGGTVQVQVVIGQDSPVDRAYAPSQNIADLGTMPGAAVNVQCYNLRRDVLETDLDCGGGTCPKCADGRECRNGARDCLSGKCQIVGQTARCVP